jgi:hypothetical protein
MRHIVYVGAPGLLSVRATLEALQMLDAIKVFRAQWTRYKLEAHEPQLILA